MIAGYTGTQRRATYTCIGNTANLAARLESHTKQTARAVLIDDATCQALAGRIATEALGPVVFKGKAVAVEVHALSA